MKIIMEFNSCLDCPYCKTGRTYGNDGRDGWTNYYCSKGAFGEHDGSYIVGKEYKEVCVDIDANCPLENIE